MNFVAFEVDLGDVWDHLASFLVPAEDLLQPRLGLSGLLIIKILLALLS